MISADCHASALPDTYRQYLDPGLEGAYDEWLSDSEAKKRRKAEHTGAAIYSEQALEEFSTIEEVAAGGVGGGWDSARRLQELEADGTVAEVLYPGAGDPSVTPFDVGLMTYQYEQDPALWLAGCRAYNRWLGDFRRQVYLGAGFTDPEEVDVVDQLGAGQLMWGSDYPHIEGTWPRSQELLVEQFAGRPDAEVAQLVGGNAADLYGFDTEALTALSADLRA